MQFESTEQSSVVHDVRKRTVYFRTARGPKIRHFDFESLDFSANAPPRFLEDIKIDLTGDVSDRFVDFSREADRSVIGKFLRSLVEFCSRTGDPGAMDAYMLEHRGFEVKGYVERALEATELIRREID